MQTNHELIPEPIGLDPDKLPKPLDWGLLYGNDNPVELEIGMGKGTFITEQAKARPDVNFFGIEWARWFWRYASDRLRRNQCDNARTVRAEAGFFLTEFVPAQSLSVLHIYFPDPWPKARHVKRRLLRPEFADLVASRLRPGGRLHVATDWDSYAAQALSVLEAHPAYEVVSGERGTRPVTRFEARGLEAGRTVHDVVARRR